MPMEKRNLNRRDDDDLSGEKSEGDSNLSRLRDRWQAEALDDATRALLAEDARIFLHQSLSTPCLNAMAVRAAGYGSKISPAGGTWIFTVITSTRSALPTLT